MNTKLINRTGLVWNKRDLFSTFLILKELHNLSKDLCILIGTVDDEKLTAYKDSNYYENMTINFPELKPYISLEQPQFTVLEKFNEAWNIQFSLIHQVNESFLWEISELIYANCENIVIFSDLPKTDWLKKYFQTLAQNYDFATATIKYWEEILNNYDFSLFNMLPDWDSNLNILLTSKHQTFFKSITAIAPMKNSWKNLSADMFHTNSIL